MPKIKVIKRTPRWPRLGVLYVIGLFLAAGNIFAIDWLSYNYTVPGATGPGSIHVGLMVTLLVIIPLLLAALSFTEQRVLSALLEAISMWLGVSTAICAWITLNDSMPASGNISVPLLLIVAYIVVRLFGLAIVRWFFVSIVIQDGSMCENCAYNLTGNTSGICPECGTGVPDSLQKILVGQQSES
ncbi:MAG: hypothetical protein ACYTF1_04595 [Planctomycetota bacterium]